MIEYNDVSYMTAEEDRRLLDTVYQSVCISLTNAIRFSMCSCKHHTGIRL